MNKNIFNPKKLLLSKWTANQPKQRERHFMVTRLHWDEVGKEVVEVELEAVINKKIYTINPADLQNALYWSQGWKS